MPEIDPAERVKQIEERARQWLNKKHFTSDSGATLDCIAMLPDDHAMAVNIRQLMQLMAAFANSELLSRMKEGEEYAHMCRDEHVQIGHNDSSEERCPLCREKDNLAAAEAEAEELRAELAQQQQISFHMDGAVADSRARAESAEKLLGSMREALGWALGQLEKLIVLTDGAAYIRGTGTELVGFAAKFNNGRSFLSAANDPVYRNGGIEISSPPITAAESAHAIELQAKKRAANETKEEG